MVGCTRAVKLAGFVTEPQTAALVDDHVADILGAWPITSQPHGMATQGGAVLVAEPSHRCGIQIVHPLRS
jgi:hypothetical protein